MEGRGQQRYLRLSDAAAKYDLPLDHLTRAVERGIVRAVRVNGFIAVAEDDVQKLREVNGEPVAELPRYLPLSEASRRYGISEEVLKRAIQSGTIEAIYLDEEVAVAEGDVEKIVIHEKEFDHLRGRPISISEASRRYKVPVSTISRWAQVGYIKRLGREGRKVLLDEADVAYCARVYVALEGGPGKRIFDSEGRPYQRKRGPHSVKPSPVVVVVE